MKDSLTVLVVEDHPVFRDGLVDILNDEDDMEVVGAAVDGDAAIVAADHHRPDVVLMDLNLPTISGIEATAAVSAGDHQPAVVVLTMTADDDSLFAALRAGARGYLLKEADATDIVRAVRAAARGEAVFGPRVADRVLAFFAAGGAAPAAVAFPQLTPREREILDLVARGMDNAGIARRLVVSQKTVRNRISDILTKLHVASRAEAVARARDAGLGGR